MAVYFAQAGADGPVKIGYARDPKRRLTLLQTGNPQRLVIVRIIAGDMADEATAHRHFADLRLNGEWFTFSEEMLTYGAEALEFNGAKKRGPAAQFHPIVQEIIDGGGVSIERVKQWRRRGVPYRVCCRAFNMAESRGVETSDDMKEFRRVTRRSTAAVPESEAA